MDSGSSDSSLEYTTTDLVEAARETESKSPVVPKPAGKQFIFQSLSLPIIYRTSVFASSIEVIPLVGFVYLFIYLQHTQ